MTLGRPQTKSAPRSTAARERHVGAVRALIGIATAAALSTMAPGPVAAASGQLDPTFAAGTRRVDIRQTPDVPAVVLARPDGRLLVGVTSIRPGTFASDAAFAQLTVAGAPDASFGDAQGHQDVDVGSRTTLMDAALTADGKVVGLTTGPAGAFAFRLNRDGSLDSGTDADPASHFGNTGIVPVQFNFAGENWTRIAVQGDGSVVVGGSTRATGDTITKTAVARFTALGVVDPAFNGGTPVTFAIGDRNDEVRAMAISPAGDRIAVAIGAFVSGDEVIGVASLRTSDGSFDNAFSQDGRTITSIAVDVGPDAIAVQGDGRIVVGGTVGNPSPERPVIVRYTTAGALDAGFANGGIFQPTFPADTRVEALRLAGAGNILAITSGSVQAIRLTTAGAFDATFDHDGRMSVTIPGNGSAVVSGTVAPGDRPILLAQVDTDTPAADAGVTRLTATGLPDTTFAPAGAGRFGLDGGKLEQAGGVAITPGGKIVIAGFAARADRTVDFTVLRLTRQGYQDPAFDRDGWAIADFGSDAEVALDVALFGPRVVAAGCTACDGFSRFAVARFTRSGALDSTFSGDGKVTTGFGPGSRAIAQAIAIQHDGRVLVAGTVNDSDFGIVRYTSGGVLDHSFSGNGKVVLDIDHGSVDRVSDVAIQDDGKVLVVGSRRQTGGQFGFAMARFTLDGTLDAGFGTDGIVTTQVGPTSSLAAAVTIRPDGRIIVAGVAVGGGHGSVALARYLPNGSPDPTFSGDGQLVDDLGIGDTRASAVIATSGDRILFGGSHDGAFLVGRYLPDGALDPSFASGPGFTETQIGEFATPAGMAVGPTDGRIVLVGSATSTVGNDDIAVARYEP